MKKEIPLLITFIAGIVLILALFIPHRPLGDLEQRFNDWYIIVMGFTLILGIDSLLLTHWDKIKRRRPGWINSVALILAFFITIFWGFASGIRTGHFLSPASTFRQYFFLYVFVPLQSTMFALLAFFIASAAYRAFRARTLDATLLLTTAALVMLGRVPGGETALPYFLVPFSLILAIFFYGKGKREVSPFKRGVNFFLSVLTLLVTYPILLWTIHNLAPLTSWIMNVPQLAAQRGIFIGIALGGIAFSLRIILGIERTYLK